MNEYIYVSGDDWNALYIEGELAYEGHDTFPYTYREFFDVEQKEANLDWLQGQGRYPKFISDVVFV